MSPYRPGAAKVFVTARILRHWASLRLDITASNIGIRGDRRSGGTFSAYEAPLPPRVRARLAPADSSSRQYITWLMARGGLVDPQQLSPNAPAAFRLLIELPRSTLGDSERKLRDNILRRASFSVDEEAAFTENVAGYLRNILQAPEDLSVADPRLTSLFKWLKHSSRSIVTHLCASSAS